MDRRRFMLTSPELIMRGGTGHNHALRPDSILARPAVAFTSADLLPDHIDQQPRDDDGGAKTHERPRRQLVPELSEGAEHQHLTGEDSYQADDDQDGDDASHGPTLAAPSQEMS